MKLIKPLRLSVLHRTFEKVGKCLFVPSVLLLFDFDEPTSPLQEVELWTLVSEQLGGESAFDECIFKDRGEVLVYGAAHPPGGEPAPAVAVRLTLGSIDKKLFVVGDRQWQGSSPSEPQPFTEMPITWEHAYGGEDYQKNPLGKGYAPIEIDGEKVHPLPNIENPKQPVSAPGEKVEPAGLSAIPLWWPQRFKKAGTHDQAWLEQQYPGLAVDIDWTFFNCAPPDQWIEGHFNGDEAFVIENMHPDKPRIASRLPGLSARCFIVRRDAEDSLEEISLRADTVHLFPGCGRGVVVFRGVTEVQEDDAADVLRMMVACERPGQARPLSHYKQVLDQRMDKEHGALYALRDIDLIPPDCAEAPLPGLAVHKTDNLLVANLTRNAQKKLDDIRQMLIEHDIDPDEHDVPTSLPVPEPQPTLDEIPEYVHAKLAEAEERRVEALREKEEALARARQLCAEHDLDFDTMLAEQSQELAGPPSYRADKELQKIRDQAQLGRNAGMPLEHVEAQLNDPDLLAKLQQTEKQLLDNYRKRAHHFPAATALAGEEAERLRTMVVAAVDAGEPLSGRDLTGADLSGLSLAGVDLSEAFLEAANLSACDLSGANLQNAVLARADLREAKLCGAQLEGINLGRAKLTGTDLSGGVALTGATLFGAQLDGANLSGARLERVDLLDVAITRCDLSGVSGEKLLFVGTENEQGPDLRDNDLSGCELKDCYFLYCNLQGVNLSGSNLSGSALLASNADGIKLDGADCTNLRVVYGSTMEGASLRGAKLAKANLQSTNLRSADLSEAELADANLIEADLEEANLQRAVAPRALLMRANLKRADLRHADLIEAIVQKANIEEADFRGANLFAVDFAKIRGNRGTKFDDANMKRIRFVERGDG